MSIKLVFGPTTTAALLAQKVSARPEKGNVIEKRKKTEKQAEEKKCEMIMMQALVLVHQLPRKRRLIVAGAVREVW
jgi:hypothetical protein